MRVPERAMKPRRSICNLDGCSRAFIATRPWHIFCSRECARADLDRVKLELDPVVVTADGQLRLDQPSPEEQAAERKRLMAQVRRYVNRLNQMPPRMAANRLLRDIRSGNNGAALRAFMALDHIWDGYPLE